MRKLLLLALLTLPLISCATGGADQCAPWRPIRVAEANRLTRETAAAILAHDLTGRRLCGW